MRNRNNSRASFDALPNAQRTICIFAHCPLARISSIIDSSMEFLPIFRMRVIVTVPRFSQKAFTQSNLITILIYLSSLLHYFKLKSQFDNSVKNINFIVSFCIFVYVKLIFRKNQFQLCLIDAIFGTFAEKNTQ